jgi:hypothetical protein
MDHLDCEFVMFYLISENQLLNLNINPMKQ